MSVGRAVAAALTAAGVAIAVGCGGDGKTGEVTGTVKFDGRYVEDGSITFFPADGKGGTAGGPIKDGKYAVPGVAAGPNKVSITATEFDKMKELYPGQKNSPKMAMTRNPIPAKYGEKTELTFDVQPGRNEKDFDLAK